MGVHEAELSLRLARLQIQEANDLTASLMWYPGETERDGLVRNVAAARASLARAKAHLAAYDAGVVLGLGDESPRAELKEEHKS
jgi:hypothetical protein